MFDRFNCLVCKTWKREKGIKEGERMKKRIIGFILVTLLTLSFCLSAMASADDWKIVNGFNTVINTGAGLKEEVNDSLVVNGYGQMCYQPKAVKKAVAVEFQINAYPKETNHYFSIGLLDTPNAVWDTSGTKAKGIMTRITVSTDGNTLNAGGVSITTPPVQNIASVASDLKALKITHTLAMYKEGNSWIYTLDGNQSMEIPVSSAALGDVSYLSVGAHGSSTMEMVILNVYIDDEVTKKIKDGTYVKDLAGDEGASKIYYDENDRLFIGEAVKDTALSYTNPANVNTAIKDEEDVEAEPQYIVYILIGMAGITLILSVVMIIHESTRNRRKSKKKHRGKESELHAESE